MMRSTPFSIASSTTWGRMSKVVMTLVTSASIDPICIPTGSPSEAISSGKSFFKRATISATFVILVLPQSFQSNHLSD